MSTQGLTRRNFVVVVTGTALAGSQGVAADRLQEHGLDTGVPEWTSEIPAINFKPGVRGSYDLTRHTRGFDARRHRMKLDAASASLPDCMRLHQHGMLVYDGSGDGASISGVILEIGDSVGLW